MACGGSDALIAAIADEVPLKRKIASGSIRKGF